MRISTPWSLRGKLSNAVTLLDIYEPVFQYVCMLSRVAKSGKKSIECSAIRQTVIPMLETAKQKSEQDHLLAFQVKKLELPIIFFLDSMIAESGLKCAAEWHAKRLAYTRSELAGDEKFFDLLDETLADPSAEATERLVIFYVCIGLGFTGWYATQPEYLRRKMETLAKRISGTIDGTHAQRICPEAYQYLDTRNLIDPPSTKIGAIALAFVALCIVVIAVNFYLYLAGSAAFRHSLDEILKHDLELVK